MNDLQKNAVNFALSNNWENAILANNEILKINPNNIDALNRLAYAYSQLRDIEKAKNIYDKVLSIDPYNYIAHKNLDKLSMYSKKNLASSFKKDKNTNQHLNLCLYIEEPGKTKTVNLINIAPPSILSNIHISDPVQFYPKKHTIEVRDCNKIYLGAIPDDLSFRLIRFIKAGNEYEVFVKNLQKKNISIFIREIKRGKRFASQPTFQTNISSYNSSTPKEVKRILSKNEDNEDNEENQEDSEV
jgi:hypothetical protein